MAKVDNPYSEAISMMRRQGGKSAGTGIGTGTVVSVSPFVIAKGDLQLTSADLYVYAGYSELVKGDTVAIALIGDQKYIILCKAVSLGG
jgi:hypothetical protein